MQHHDISYFFCSQTGFLVSVLFWSSQCLILDDGNVEAKQRAAWSLVNRIGQALSKPKTKLSLAAFLITLCMPGGRSEQSPPTTVFRMGLQCQNAKGWITSDFYPVTCIPSCQLQTVSSSDKKSALTVLWWSRFASFAAFIMQKLYSIKKSPIRPHMIIQMITEWSCAGSLKNENFSF